MAGEVWEGQRLTDQERELTQTERDTLLAEWAYLIARIREVALKLGYPNPIPSRKERRQADEIDQTKS